MLYMQGHDVNTHGRLIASNAIGSVAVVLWVLLHTEYVLVLAVRL